MDWYNIWEEFNEWYQSSKTEPDWTEQQEKIQELVEQALKG